MNDRLNDNVREDKTPTPVKEKPAELEINNVKELDEKLAEAINNNENKPSDEEVEEAKKEFEEKSDGFATKFWDVGELEDSQTNLDYMEHYIQNRVFWTQTGWMGVIKMKEVIEQTQETLKLEPNVQLALGYQALEFMFYSFQNAGGVGLQSAVDFELENEIYAKVFDTIGKKLTEARTEIKDIQFLQDKYAAMAQGFYLEIGDAIVEGEDIVGEEDKENTGVNEDEMGIQPSEIDNFTKEDSQSNSPTEK